ncbi:TetR/AcrR family transcriptional regulator [Acinetobacter puyangensis]|uniref:Transcriptional regulator, TetR family n=1 Tax=Acinetobacter puyangensis TaxID=1096779 RepID=A0A240EBM7_9GAMM|nr:TetR/AcrR family transcriptional regulator [Acinetobacter puyangensis]SNX45936.1 transcriptional regulator, TetR family [Acinetobacter puyangensis]
MNSLQNALKASSNRKKTVSGRPNRQDSEVLHENLLHIATEHFLAFGFQGASIEGIAKSAQVSKLTIYRQYQNKQGLFLAVLESYVQQYIQDLEHTLSDKEINPKNLLALGVFIAGRWLDAHNIGLARIVIAEMNRIEGLSQVINPLMQQSRAPVENFLKRLNDLPDYTIENIQLATIQFIQLSVLGHYYFLRDDSHLPNPEQLQQHVQAAVQLFLNGCKNA